MSPELGFALFLTLLWGPTALWLVARVLRGQRGRLSGSFNSESEVVQRSEAAPYDPDALASQGFWICSACNSMNRPQAKRCYSCGQEINAEGRRVPDRAPQLVPEGAPELVPDRAPELVPVMAEGPARSGGAAPRTNVVLAAPPPGGRRATAPVADPPARDPRRKATASPVEPAPHDRRRKAAEAATEPAPPDRRRKAAVPALAVLPADPVCPFLGFGNDPTTRCSFPDPRNRCHTPAQPGNDPAAFPLRLIPGKAGTMRTLEIGPEHQGALCLTASHEQCARFPAVRVLAGSR